jgi:hypothetical protein
MTYRGDYQESPWHPRQGRGYQQPQDQSWTPRQYDPDAHRQRLGSYQQPQGRSWAPQQYDQGAHLRRLGHFQRPPQPPGPAWQAAASASRPGYGPPPQQSSQPGRGPGRPSRAGSSPARRRLAALHRRIKSVSSLSG